MNKREQLAKVLKELDNLAEVIHTSEEREKECLAHSRAIQRMWGWLCAQQTLQHEVPVVAEFATTALNQLNEFIEIEHKRLGEN